ncbi:topoisomerase IV subunit A [Escherichia coli]|uniref:Topoisomerase IV subunit A n=1 Tax=Escherichia coli TaxID=562 RepID=A0A376MI96_ECOLX|nr:topoisomerase IV subunit A [Escherichia coli]
MPPVVIEDASDMLLAITQAGRMLMFPVSDLPQLSKGKGNKIIKHSVAEAARGEDGLAQLYVLPPQSTLTFMLGNAKLNCVGRATESHWRTWTPRYVDARFAAYRSC